MNPGNDLNLSPARLDGRAFRLLAKLRRSEDGVTAVEFAIILPFMLFLLIGMTQLADALNQDRKVSRIANSIADLIAQEETLTSTDLDSLLNIGENILDPYPSTNLQVIAASVSFDASGDATVDWSRDSNGSEPWAEGTAPPFTLPATVATPNTSIVVGQTNLGYTPNFVGFLDSLYGWSPSALTLSDTYYLAPRITDTVTCGTC